MYNMLILLYYTNDVLKAYYSDNCLLLLILPFSAKCEPILMSIRVQTYKVYKYIFTFYMHIHGKSCDSLNIAVCDAYE